VRQLLVVVEEELDAAQARLFGFELEAPFDDLGREWVIGRGVGRVGVAYFGRNFVGGYAIAARPAVDGSY
jgi:hypothetical protein